MEIPMVRWYPPKAALLDWYECRRVYWFVLAHPTASATQKRPSDPHPQAWMLGLAFVAGKVSSVVV